VAETIFLGHLYDSNEKWAFYKAYDFEFPSTEELKHLKGIVFPGSKYSAYDDETLSWLPPLKENIRRVYNEYP
jgi:GMP synthase-like glutamine amidotransferase